MKRLTSITLALIITLISPATALAETINLEVTDNGAGSTSEVQLTNQTETTIEQSNQAQVTNDVTTEANTGNNQANGNQGDVAITTGDVTTTTDVTNNLNSNQVDLDCCESGATTVKIAGNGTDSTNQISLAVGNQTTVSQTNQVTINNFIVTKANTGNNTVSDNTGSTITVNTGNIYHETNITNTLNSQLTTVPIGKSGAVTAYIKQNGAGSTNSIAYKDASSLKLASVNLAFINNSSINHLNTGNNTVTGNTGALIAVNTGDIFSITSIKNTINSIITKITCCDDSDSDGEDPEDPEDDDEDPDDPGDGDGDPDDNGGNGGNGGNGNGSSDSGRGGPDNYHMLPITGLSSSIFAANFLLLLLGLILRFQPWQLARVKTLELNLTLSF